MPCRQSISDENEGINPSNCQSRAECCKTSNLVGSHRGKTLISSVRLEKTAHAAAAKGCCSPEEIDVAANAAATSGDDGEAAEVVQWLDGGR